MSPDESKFVAADESTVEIPKLRSLLEQASMAPPRILLHRLRALDGREWLEGVLRSALFEIGDEGATWAAGTQTTYQALKTAGKSRLKTSESRTDLESATAIYFAGVAGLLSADDLEDWREVCSLEAAVVEEVLQVLEETVDPAWAPRIRSALRWFD